MKIREYLRKILPTGAHADRSLTVRQAFEQHYDKSRLRTTTLKLYGYVLTCWEKGTGNPPIGDVSNETVEQFVNWCVNVKKLSPVTANTYWKMLRSLFRRLAPQETGNPSGLGIIDRVPYVRLLRTVLKIARRVDLADIDKVYLACNSAQFPRLAGVLPARMWQALIVVAYTTALRKGDLAAIRLADIDLTAGELRLTAQKTLKPGVWPLHPAAIEHIQSIWGGREFLFEGMSFRSGDIHYRWNKLIEKAEVPHFSLHDLRRTASSEIDRAAPGMSSVLLQHRPTDVTGTFYLNRLPELAEAILKMRVPITFRHGVMQGERKEAEAKRRREDMMRTADFRAPAKPSPSDWVFPDGQASMKTRIFYFRSRMYSVGAAQWRLLRVLALSNGPSELETLAAAIYDGRQVPETRERIGQRVASAISTLRRALQRQFDLHPRWDPVPCVSRGDGGHWNLILPADAAEGGRVA